jgi:uncharacterized protein (TIGR03000 family)
MSLRALIILVASCSSLAVAQTKPPSYPTSPYPLAAPRPTVGPVPMVTPMLPSIGQWGYGGWGWGGYGCYDPFFYQQPVVVINRPTVFTAPSAPALAGAGKVDADTVLMAKARVSAVMVMTVPGAATWTVDGVDMKDEVATRELESLPIAIGAEHTFKVTAHWKDKDGKLMEAQKTVTVRAGERSKVTVYTGMAVK